MEDMEKLNPDSVSVTVGTRKRYHFSIYPLAFGDQLKMTNFVMDAVRQFGEQKTFSDVVVLKFAIDTVSKNLDEILKLCTDEDEIQKILTQSKKEGILYLVTNEQLVEIATVIYQMNFETAIKKGRDLLEKIKSQYPSERSLPGSSKPTLNIGSPTSSKEDSEKEG